MEKFVFKISLIVLIIGLISLFIIAEEFNPKAVESIDKPLEEVKISGKVNKIVNKNKVSFLEIEGKKIENVEVVVLVTKIFLFRKETLLKLAELLKNIKVKKKLLLIKLS